MVEFAGFMRIVTEVVLVLMIAGFGIAGVGVMLGALWLVVFDTAKSFAPGRKEER